MEYYIIKNDSMISNLVRIKLPEKKLERQEPFVVFANLGEDVECPDIVMVNQMMKKAILVSDRMKKLMQYYTDKMMATAVIVVDTDRKRQENYWNIHLEEIDCVLNKENDIFLKIEKLRLSEEKVKGKHLFEIKFGKETYLCCSLVFAENVMRKNFFGAEWIKVVTEE